LKPNLHQITNMNELFARAKERIIQNTEEMKGNQIGAAIGAKINGYMGLQGMGGGDFLADKLKE
jgi:hypothetical protein